jgi:hypothetical protein
MSAWPSNILEGGPDEAVVLSVLADEDPGGAGWRLRHGSCLIVPQQAADVSWAEWCSPGGTVSPNHRLPARFCVSGEGWLAARQPLSLRDGRQWLEEVAQIADLTPGLLANEMAPGLRGIGCIPDLQVELDLPTDVIRAMPGLDSAVSNFLAGPGRPAVGLLWRAPAQPDPLELPQVVGVGDAWTTWPSRDLTGIHITSRDIDPRLQLADGLFVARLERRAWIAEMRGTKEADSVRVMLGWEPSYVDLRQLALQFEEFTYAGELVVSERINLADLELGSLSRAGSAEVRLPSMGSKLRYSMSLYAPDGSLLDRTGPYGFLEQIVMRFEVNDAQVSPINIGEPRARPTLEERVSRAEQLKASLNEVARSGTEARVLREYEHGRALLRHWLEAAREYLLVMDPYFGQETTDWELLDGLPVPVRVLTGKMSEKPVTIPDGVTVRARRKAVKSMHDRRYVWRGGGLGLGGSISAVGHAPVGVSFLTPPEAEYWQAIFEGLWESGLFPEI